MGFKGDLMSKTQTRTIFAFFLFTIFFALLSACGGGGSDKNGSDPGSSEPDPSFTSTWRVPADSKTITLPLVDDAAYTYNFTVDWGDGSPISEITAHDDEDKTHTYESKGDYNLVIEGTLEAWSFNNAGDKDKILSVENFGDLGYKNLSGAFHGCTNLGDFEGGVTSAVTDMTSMFEGATRANPDVSNWDVSSVTGTGMTNMFNSSGLSKENYDAFLINLADNNASVEDVILGAIGIYYTSDDAKTARDTLANDRNWTITDGGDYAALFRSTWRVTADGETITLPLVDDGSTYNFTVDWGDGSPISEITAHNDPAITHTYATAGDYELLIAGTLEAWSFNNTGDKDKILSVENFGDLGYKNLSGAFHGCTNLGDFAGGVTSAVTDMSSMFEGATSANPDVSNWDVSKVTDMADMFNGAAAANPDVSGWVVSSVTGTGMTNMFNSSGLSTANYDAFLINLAGHDPAVSGVTLGATGIQYSSYYAKIAQDTLENDRGWTITDGGDATSPFLSTWRVPANSKTITLPLVSGYNYNFTVNWGDGNLSEITAHDDADKTHTYATAADYNLVIDGLLEAWSFNDTGDKDKILSVEDFGDLGYKNLSGAFYGSTNLSAFEGGITSDVTDMYAMFAVATNATPNLSDWDVSKVTNMASMFNSATSANPNVSSWNVSKVTNMAGMFNAANSVNPDVSDWNVSKVTNMANMFFFANSADPDVSSWNVSKVTNMANMFFAATSANPNVSSWNVSSVTTMEGLFNNSAFSTANYDAFLINLAGHDPAVTGVALGASGIMYSSDAAKTAKDTLEGRGWTITDGGDATPPPSPPPSP